MKKVLLSLLLTLGFVSYCAADCPVEIKTFYTGYMTNLLQNDDAANKALCNEYMTARAIKQAQKATEATDADAIIRGQDLTDDAVETLQVKSLGGDRYAVSYYFWKNDSNTLIQIPLKARTIDGRCRIVAISTVGAVK